MNRRRFISALPAVAAFPVAAKALGLGEATPAPSPDIVTPRALIRPRGLRSGMTIGIVSPASGTSTSDVRDFVSFCQQRGMRVRFGENISKRVGYLSAPDDARAREFMAFVEDPTIDAIVCARGGYGVMRILPMLDFTAIRQAGKLIMGFSDITALLIAVHQISRVVTFHGPVASSTFDAFTTTSLVSMTVADPAPSSEPLSYTDRSVTTIAPGMARGKLTGGNLAMIVSTLGTKYEIDTTHALLFLEEISEEPYRIDRMLTQLWLAGKLQTCTGIAIGSFRDCESKGAGIPGPSMTLRQVLDDRLGPLGIPVVYGLPFGHVRSKLTLPIGVYGELDASARSLRVLESAVE